MAIWGYLKVKRKDQESLLKAIGFAKQEGDQSKSHNHAEARWLASLCSRLTSLLGEFGKDVEQIEFDLTKDPCGEHCRPYVFKEIRRLCTARLGDTGLAPMYIFLSKNRRSLVFDRFLVVDAKGSVSTTPEADV